MCIFFILERDDHYDHKLWHNYSGTSEQRTLWDQYKFKWFVPCIEVALFKRFQSHYIDMEGDKFGDLVVSIVERYIIQCLFLGGSSLRGSTVNVLFEDPLMLVQGRRKHW